MNRKFCIEYLVLFKHNEMFCNSIEAFKNLLQTHSDIKVNKDIYYKNFIIEYQISTFFISDRKERLFEIRFICDEIEGCSEFLKVLRTLLYKVNATIQVVQNDISFYYAKQSYPLIYKIENLLRKLITKFMLRNVGSGWVEQTLPNKLKSSLQRKKSDIHDDALFRTDFIELGDFLFEPYSNFDIGQLYQKLRKIEPSSPLKYEDLQAHIPQSNWERFFIDVVKYDPVKLHKEWRKLYLLRCSVAHNNLINKQNYEQISKLVAKLERILEEALNSLEKVVLSDSQKVSIVEYIALQEQGITGEYVKGWNKFYTQLIDLHYCFSPSDKQQELLENMKSLTLKVDIIRTIYPFSNHEELLGMLDFHDEFIQHIGGYGQEIEEERIIAETDRLEKTTKALQEYSYGIYGIMAST